MHGYKYLTVLLFCFIHAQGNLSQEKDFPPSADYSYYLQLQNDEFFETMIPREQFLLDLVELVNYEISKRKAEGFSPSDLGIYDIVSPEEKVLGALADEIRKIRNLLDEIEKLERIAKQHVNFEVLEILSGLKARVNGILRGEYDSLQEDFSSDTALESTDSEDDTPHMELDEESRRKLIFDQWKYNRLLDYKLNMTKYLFLRLRLLQTANEAQEKRMFQIYYRRSLENYSAGDFMLARLELRDILQNYGHLEVLDDVLYYASEAAYGLNLFDEAILGYEQLLRHFPQSSFRNQAITKLIYIYYIYGDYQRLDDYYSALLVRGDSVEDENMTTVSYLVGYAYFKTGQYPEALDVLSHIIAGTRYYYPALYLSGTCYSNLKQTHSAMKLYQRIIQEIGRKKNDPLLGHIANNSYLKLGLLHYEMGDPDSAIGYLDQVDSNYEHYDLSLMGKAWSAYQAGRPGEAIFNVEGLLNHGMVSNYAYEARVLAATSKELMGLDEEAIKDLKNVHRAQNKVSRWPEGAAAEETEEEDLIRKSREFDELDVLEEMKSIRQFLNQSALRTMRPHAVRNPEADFQGTVRVLDEKIVDLDRLEEEARFIGDRTLLEEIRQLRGDLLKSLEAHTDNMASLGGDPEGDPLVDKMGLMAYLKYGFQTLLEQTLNEKEQTTREIRQTEQKRRQAGESDDFTLMIEMEIQREELEDYYGKLNQYEVWLRENFPEEFEVELDRWASFSGYGISSINFRNIKETEAGIARVSETIDVLDKLFDAKRNNLESRIQELLSDVEQIEHQMKEEAEKNENLERDRFFRIHYFDRQQKEAKVGPLKTQEKTGGKEEKR